ncbi:DUF952 domain-containing protein [Pseudochrobactrum sp. sp1633]|uniref:DUF952 domain-containing protein n=1 Tax=Pseudochrobactrum sp. sp1633 TaxID=3036706 RepID=UPI0025A67E0C|nr:DUF952 domain-containing protein [Pseudochrobactrum sp. sp1633]MDM8346510.1 DUF952 domain-containing protein [Pseudochrobactrum sp. sp1633]HWD12726.1 DUF952 domain-containing protein [Pseudochrobactrum sp.]
MSNSDPSHHTIYKIATRAQWADAEKAGHFSGAPVDLQDGYIHFSTDDTVAETAAKHFARQHDLLLVAVDANQLGDELRYEISRGGKAFPHLYANLQLTAVRWVKDLPLDSDGKHQFPELEQ